MRSITEVIRVHVRLIRNYLMMANSIVKIEFPIAVKLKAGNYKLWRFKGRFSSSDPKIT